MTTTGTDDARLYRSKEELAAALGLSPRQARDRMRYGSLPGVKVGGQWMLPESAYQQLVALSRTRGSLKTSTNPDQEAHA